MTIWYKKGLDIVHLMVLGVFFETSGSIPRKFYRSGFDLHFLFGDLKQERNREQTAPAESAVILLCCQKNGTTLSQMLYKNPIVPFLM